MNNNEFSTSVQNILRSAKKKALSAGDSYVDLCHMLHAMISNQNSNVYKILINIGCDIDSMRRELNIEFFENKNPKQEITEYILHHVKDSHDFGLLSYKDKKTNRKVYVGVPLPIIIYDKGFKFFMSSKFDHGRKVAKIDDSYYILFHN